MASFARILGGLALLWGLLVAPGMGEGTTWVVNSGADDGGAGTLRAAVLGAVDGDTIVFSSAVPLVSLSDYLFLNKALTLRGPVQIRQISTGKRVLYVTKDCTLEHLELFGGNLSTGNGTMGAGVVNYATLTMKNCTVRDNTGGGGIHNGENLILRNCRIANNSANGSTKAGGISNTDFGYSAVSVTMSDCIVENNTCSNGNAGGMYNGVKGTVSMARCTVRNNGNSGLGGGLYLSMYSTTTLTDHTFVTGNTPDQICCGYGASYTADATCQVGSAPNSSAYIVLGHAGATPSPRNTAGEPDVLQVGQDLANASSALKKNLASALSQDLGRVGGVEPGRCSTTLYYANTFENVAVVSRDLSVEYTASWPEHVRYYALFSRADGSGYELAERGVQFELEAGQSLPEGVTPPEFYTSGEGLMTWRNVIADGGSYDLNPTAGVVTFRVCSVRAAALTENPGSGGGCHAGEGAGFAPLVLLLALPLCAGARAKDLIRK